MVHFILCCLVYTPCYRLLAYYHDFSDRARCLKVGVHEKPDLPETFHERCTREFVGNSGAPPPQKKIKFGIGGDSISRSLEGLLTLFSLFIYVFNGHRYNTR